jgi:hypothetical protein
MIPAKPSIPAHIRATSADKATFVLQTPETSLIVASDNTFMKRKDAFMSTSCSTVP